MQWPHPRYLLALERTLGRSAIDLGFIPRGKASIDRLTAARSTMRTTPGELPRGANPSYSRAVPSGGTSDSTSTPTVPPVGRIGRSHVAYLHDRLSHLHGRDACHGDGDLAAVAAEEFARVSDALATCTYSEQVEQELYAAAGEFAASAGWFAFDSGSTTTAGRYYDQALRLALIANDPVLHAHVLVVMAIQAVFAGRPAECTSIARAGLRQNAARNSPVITALFHARAGAGLARCGEAVASARAFVRAERALDQHSDSGPVPPWLTFFGPGELSGLVAQAHLALGNYKAAEQAAVDTLTQIDPCYSRNRLLYQVTQARAQLGRGSLDEACATATRALQTGRELNSHRGFGSLHKFRTKITSQSRSPVVRNFLDAWGESGPETEHSAR